LAKQPSVEIVISLIVAARISKFGRCLRGFDQFARGRFARSIVVQVQAHLAAMSPEFLNQTQSRGLSYRNDKGASSFVCFHIIRAVWTIMTRVSRQSSDPKHTLNSTPL